MDFLCEVLVYKEQGVFRRNPLKDGIFKKNNEAILIQ
jgi:hypothetical protein